MDTRRDFGCCYLFPKTSGDPYIIQLSEYDRAVTAWQSGESFFATQDIWGGACVFRLNDIVCISKSSPATIANARAELAELKRRDVAEGMD